MTIVYNTSIVRSGLVLHLDAANPKSYPGSGTVWKDLSGNLINGSLVNGPTYNSSNRGYISFDGTNDRVDIGNPTLVNSALAGNFTYEICVYLQAGGTSLYSKIFSKALYNGGVNGLLVTYDRSAVDYKAVIELSSSLGLGSYIYLASTTPIVPNNWYHLLITRIGSTVNYYINGVIVSIATYAADLSNSLNLRIGSNSATTPGEYQQQRVGLFRFYNIGFTDVQVSQNFEATRGRYKI